MSDPYPFYDEYTELVPMSAGVTRSFQGVARYLYVFSASGSFEVSLDGGPLFVMNVAVGLKFDQGFSKIRFKDTSGSNNTIFYAITNGEIDDRRLTVSGSINATVTSGGMLASVADVSLAAAATTQIVGSNANRKGVLITNLACNAETIRLGDADIGVNRGLPVAVGVTAYMETQAAVHCYNPHTDSLDVAVLETLL